MTRYRASDAETRTVPITPELVGLLRADIERYGTSTDGRVFQTARGGIIQDPAYSAVPAGARAEALAPAQCRSPLGRRPYDLRHAAVPLWLNSGVPATEVARCAGHRQTPQGQQPYHPACQPPSPRSWCSRRSTDWTAKNCSSNCLLSQRKLRTEAAHSSSVRRLGENLLEAAGHFSAATAAQLQLSRLAAVLAVIACHDAGQPTPPGLSPL